MQVFSVSLFILVSCLALSPESRAGGAINTMPVDTVTSSVSPDGTYVITKGKDFTINIEKDNTVTIIYGTNAIKVRDSGSVVENSGSTTLQTRDYRDITATIESGSAGTSGTTLEADADNGSNGTMPVVERKTVTNQTVTTKAAGTSGSAIAIPAYQNIKH